MPALNFILIRFVYFKPSENLQALDKVKQKNAT